MNKIRHIPIEITVAPETSATPEKQKPVTPRKKKSSNQLLKAFNVFGLFEKDMMISMLPFVFFLTGLALIYIANSYCAERTIREIDKTAKDLKELRSEYITTKSDLSFKSNQSQVAASVLPEGLKESRVAPKKIIVSDGTKNKNKTD